jgi:CRISPR/Cas system-associated exonuclease Cas4 (RecB family)
MSSFYKPNRNPDWNYGGKNFRLSRSKIDLFLNCPRCFYIDNKLGTARPPGFPFNLNSAVDELLKKEFDVHRANGTIHPLAEAYGVKARPYDHPQIDIWRDALRHGVQYLHPETGFNVRGGIDDVWVDEEGKLIVVDYKATSKDGKIEELDADWHIGYKRQMEVYQWLFRKNGFEVNNLGYFVYANASKDRKAFDAKLEFEVTLVPYEGNDSWVDQALIDAKACLDQPDAPAAAKDCDYCTYREVAGRALLTLKQKNLPAAGGPSTPAPKPAKVKKTDEKEVTETLF